MTTGRVCLSYSTETENEYFNILDIMLPKYLDENDDFITGDNALPKSLQELNISPVTIRDIFREIALSAWNNEPVEVTNEIKAYVYHVIRSSHRDFEDDCDDQLEDWIFDELILGGL